MFVVAKPSFPQRVRFKIASFFSKIAKRVGYHQTQLVVCGYPRGGTSLLYNMLSATLQHKFKFTSFEKYYIRLIHKLGNIASKAPLDVNHLSHIDELNINNKKLAIIIAIRDIRDVVTSKHPIYHDEYFIGYDHSFWPKDNAFKKWGYEGSGVIEITEKIKQVLSRDDVILIKYEDLVENPDAIQETLRTRFDLPFEGKFSNYHKFKGELAYKYEGKYKANDESLVLEGKAVVNRQARWKSEKFDSRITSQFTACPALFDILEEFGYETNRDWFEPYKPRRNDELQKKARQEGGSID